MEYRMTYGIKSGIRYVMLCSMLLLWQCAIPESPHKIQANAPSGAIGAESGVVLLSVESSNPLWTASSETPWLLLLEPNLRTNQLHVV